MLLVALLYVTVEAQILYTADGGSLMHSAGIVPAYSSVYQSAFAPISTSAYASRLYSPFAATTANMVHLLKK